MNEEAVAQINKIMDQIDHIDDKILALQKVREYHMRRYHRVVEQAT